MPEAYKPTKIDRVIWHQISECASEVGYRVRHLESEMGSFLQDASFVSAEFAASEKKKIDAALAVLRPILVKLRDSEGM